MNLYIVLNGAAEDKTFEPYFIDITDWFMDNKAPGWQQSLEEAAKASRDIMYSY